MSDTETVDQLFPTLGDDQIAVLRRYGVEESYAAGSVLFSEDEPAQAIFVVLSGQLKVTRSIGRETATLTVHAPGQFAGELSLLAGLKSSATGIAVGELRVLRLSASEIERAFAEHPKLKELMLGALAKRKPEADAQLMQREKMAALGKLSAGLAHELNNPAAAISRASAQLREVAVAHLAQSLALGHCVAGFSTAEEIVRRLEAKIGESALEKPLSPIERSDLEDALGEWLQDQGVKDAWGIAPELVAANLDQAELEQMADAVSGASLSDVAAWIAGALGSLSLISQIELSSWRLSEVIGAIKSYTYMDQAAVQEVDVAAGIETTLTLLRHKLKGVVVTRGFESDLPKVTGRGGDLNQVWTNLIDNAIDAMDEAGTLSIAAASQSGQVVVEIGDTGSGIDPAAMPHIFEPFYTTKEIGSGTGLGLDTVYRIVVDEHRGEITARSHPGSTVFTVRLPIHPTIG